MELLITLIGLAIFSAVSAIAGADSRPGLDDEPHRAI